MTSPLHAFHPRNLLTYAGLLLGLAAMAAALRGRAGVAGALVALAVIADTFDGRFARLFTHVDERARFGGELDSLCDTCAFGIAPVVCTAALAPAGQAVILCWAAGCFYLASTVTRLAFYNVTHGTVRGFVGLPAPVAALIWSSALCITGSAGVLTAVLVGAGTAMVAPWRLPRPTGARLVLFALWPVVVFSAHLMAR